MTELASGGAEAKPSRRWRTPAADGGRHNATWRILSLEQAIADIGQEGVAVPEKHIHRLRTRGPCSIRQQSRRGLPVDNLERRCAERGVV
jgi:hypothetical protein